MQEIIKSPLYNAQLLRTLGHTAYGGAEIGECFAIAGKIEPGNKESWYEQWISFADKNYKLGTFLTQEKLHNDAKSAFLRASNYYRTAFFFLEDQPDDQRIEYALQKSVMCFHKAIKYFDSPVETIAIPFKDSSLPGYLYLSPSQSEKRKPLIIDTGGGDGTKEESYFGTAAEALRHGMHCLTFEGPGQGSVLRLNKIPFIPNWEEVIEKVVDFISQRPEIDKNKIILIGRSFGGYLAARALSHEKRIAACIVDPGIFEPGSSMELKLRALADKEFPELKNAQLYEVLERLMEKDETLRFMMNSRKWRFGAKNIKDMLDKVASYSLEGLVEKIQCPMLVCDNTLEYITLGQAKKLYTLLRCKKDYLLFSAEDGTGGHCEPLAPKLFNAKVYTWLNKQLS